MLFDLTELTLALPLLFFDIKGGRIGNGEVAALEGEAEPGLPLVCDRKVGEGALLDDVVGESVNGGARPGDEPSSTPLSERTLRASIDFLFLAFELVLMPLLPPALLVNDEEGDLLGVSGGAFESSIEEASILAVLSIHNPPGNEIEGGN